MSIKRINRPFVQRVLPLVYDDSLSYYETLAKLRTKINEIVDFCNEVVESAIVAYIDRRFNELLVGAIYDEENETIILSNESED